MSTAKSARTADKAEMSAGRSAWWARYKSSLRYALYVITHPFDGFWDLTHEHRGTLAAANTFLILFLITRVLKLLCTSFQFINAPIQHINVFEEMGSLLLPFLILCLANWAMTTLFDGKGRFIDIYIGMCYALVPYVLIQLPMILVSNMLTFEEGSIYSVLLPEKAVLELGRFPDCHHCRRRRDHIPDSRILQPAERRGRLLREPLP